MVRGVQEANSAPRSSRYPRDTECFRPRSNPIIPETPEEKSVINGIPQLTVKELKARIDAGQDAYLIDVREPYEYQIAPIGGKLIPQNEVPNRLAEIDRDREVIVHCRSGARSQRIAEYLKQVGYPRVVNLAGGILAWSDEIDPKVPKY